jgi:hypothetical protein
MLGNLSKIGAVAATIMIPTALSAFEFRPPGNQAAGLGKD